MLAHASPTTFDDPRAAIGFPIWDMYVEDDCDD